MYCRCSAALPADAQTWALSTARADGNQKPIFGGKLYAQMHQPAHSDLHGDRIRQP